MQLHAMGLQRLTGAHTRAHPCSNAHSARASSTHGRRQLRVQSVRLPWSWASTAAGGHRNTDGVDASAQRLRASGRPPTTPRWPRQAAMSCATFASLTGAWGSGGGGSGGGNGNSGGGDGGWHWGDGGAVPGSGGAPASNVLADVALNEAPDMVEEVILMDVGGMKCGGCVGHVKRVLEEQGDVREASVNLATETALVRVLVPRGSKPQDMKAIGDKLAQALTDKGFKSTVRSGGSIGGGTGSGAPGMSDGPASSTADVMASKRAAKEAKLRDVTMKLIVAWVLSAVCGLGHVAHALGSEAPAWLHSLHSVPLHAALSAVALVGPGRDIIVDGFKSLAAKRPDMNTLVGLGATASFGVSCAAALLPKLGWKTFFEEPAMLLGFVLVGRALEERAKLRASADMAALQDLVPTRARLTLSGGQYRDIPADMVGPGDLLTVLPGDRMPVDGVVVSGRSTVDESALTGEPMPSTKAEGDKVTAGTVNCDGLVQVRAEHSGQQTVIADIVRMVEMAQARTAPIQRLADAVAGKFAYGVMGISLATFTFWSTVGTKMFPQVLAAAAGKTLTTATAAAAPTATATLLLSLQLACNVLVTACPCALGLATPTAVLVGTGVGARRGLLIRGGDILEATSQVDTVVFDKTGTLTLGKPQVTQVLALDPSSMTSEQVLQLAASVEGSTTHPVAQAVVRAARAAAAKCLGSSGKDGQAPESEMQAGTFVQEPGSGVRATVDGQVISVGTLDWVQRQGAELPPQFEAGMLQNGMEVLPVLPVLAEQGVQGSAQLMAQAHNAHNAQQQQQQQQGVGQKGVQQRQSYGSKVDGAELQGVQVHGTDGSVRMGGPSQGHSSSNSNIIISSSDGKSSGGEAHQGASQILYPPSQDPSSINLQGHISPPSTDNQGPNLTPAAAQLPVQGALSSLQGVGSSHSRVFVGVGGKVVGAIDVQDALRHDAKETVEDLHRLGVRTVMLSGDREGAANEVAASVGISPKDVYANVKPAGKAQLVEELRSQGRLVAMVGDGINDTAALAAAHVGIAMGGGVDAASEVAKVVLMGDHLHQVTDAIHLSRATLGKIRQNLGWALGYNLIGIPLAAGALLPSMGICLTPSLSGAMMGASSVLVVSNSLLLQWELRGLRKPAGAPKAVEPSPLKEVVTHGEKEGSRGAGMGMQSS